MNIIAIDQYGAALNRLRQPFHDRYYAMYSSHLGGIVTDPVLMQVPVDDHLVHRGDGVFETVKCMDGAIYNLDGHLERLARSATAIGLVPPAAVTEVLRATVRAGGQRNCLIRIIVSRGPGGFTVAPSESVGAQLYLVAYALTPPFMQRHPGGAVVIRSSIPVKAPLFATVKSCNYLPNALMKHEAEQAGADIAVAFDQAGYLAEGATENIGIVSRDNRLLFPRPDGILRGTTMLRAMALAGRLVADGLIQSVGFADITAAAIAEAREVLIAGTTMDITTVRRFDGRATAGPLPGPVFTRLSELLQDDMLQNELMRTPVFE